MVIIDTVASAFVVTDNNSQAEIAKVMKIMGDVAKETDTVVMGVVHANHIGDKNRAAGSHIYYSLADSEVVVYKEDKVHHIKQTKTKRNVLGHWDEKFQFFSVTLFDKDEWGQPIKESFITHLTDQHFVLKEPGNSARC